MNIQPQFLSSPEYMRFKKRIGLQAMEFIVKLGIRCQQTKSSQLAINNAEDLEFMLGIEEGGSAILEALVSSGLVDPEGGEYHCAFFVQMNKQLLSNWRNGELKSIQAKSNKTNTTESNSTQYNRMPKQCLSNASKDEEPFFVDESPW